MRLCERAQEPVRYMAWLSNARLFLLFRSPHGIFAETDAVYIQILGLSTYGHVSV